MAVWSHGMGPWDGAGQEGEDPGRAPALADASPSLSVLLHH